MKEITILGSTGSIGTQSLDVVRNNPNLFSVKALSCGKNTQLLLEQIKEFAPEMVVVSSEAQAIEVQKQWPKLYVSFGPKGLVEAAMLPSDILINALVGMIGLEPTYYAALEGKTIALANKETLVAGGRLIMEAVSKNGARLLPVDSEHSAIFQCLEGNQGREIRNIILTASGGPFRGRTLKELETVTKAQALKHPSWSMGAKITIDSATMMNKGLEVIEARWLFNVLGDRIKVVVHPQSIIHSMVEYRDRTIIAQLGLPDMRMPIAYALSYPERLNMEVDSLNFFELDKGLTFEKPNMDTFVCLNLAYKVLDKEDSYSVALNGANEVLVDRFLKEEISFIHIQRNLEKLMEAHRGRAIKSLEDIFQVDREARQQVLDLAGLKG